MKGSSAFHDCQGRIFEIGRKLVICFSTQNLFSFFSLGIILLKNIPSATGRVGVKILND